MKYVPGFSQHLQQFARGGRARFDEEMIYDADQFEQPMMFDAEQPYVDPYQYAAPIEQPYVAPYTAPIEQQFVSPRYNGEDTFNAAPVEQPYVAPYVAPTETPYVPGFTNYLASSTPPAAETAAPVSAVAPADAPNYFSGLNLSDADLAGLSALSSSDNFNQGNYGSDFGSLDNIYGMNFGSDFGSGGSGGSLYKVNPYLQSFQAPLSDKGNPTAYGGGGIEVKSPTQTFRLLDKNTGQVVYEGVGYEGAQEAINRANALTAEGGAKAQWQIQTPNSQQESGYSVLANEKRSQSTLGDIASVALPVGMAILTGGMSLPAQMAAAGIAGAAGAGLAGKNPAKAGLISAATAGLMGGSGANEAIGKAVGNVGNTLAAKTIEEGAKTAAEKAAEQIIVTGLSKAAQGAGSAIGNTLLSEGVKSGLSSVTGYKTPAEKFADQPLPNTPAPAADIYSGLEPIDVTALGRFTQGTGDAIGNAALSGVVKGPLSEVASAEQPKTAEDIEAEKNPMVVNANTAGSGLPFGAAFSVPVNEILSGALTAAQPKTAEDIEAEKNPMVVSAYRPVNPIGGSVTAGLPALTELAMDPTLAQPATEDIVVTGNKAIPKTVVPDELAPIGSVLASLGIPQIPTPDPALTDPNKRPKLGVEEYLRLLSLLAGLADGGGKGTPGTYGGGGSGRLNPIFSAKLPDVSGFAARKPRDVSGVDFKTYGYRPGIRFFDNGTPINYGSTPPITSPIPNNPAGPIMTSDEPVPLAHGGALGAKRGGPSHRTEFAVNGPGTGRSDDIPAVLSDGEYVIDAETVALLGDGSSKAGAKKLDDLRVKVRKHKGKKLAKGRFSANAKKPEAYLSGGRI